ncbi:glycosyltransferase family 4 protein [Gryllotalpicola protaetiae]|nr:glycosyltransferase family 4 protein [Gryllotalpicola protaetiae]
MPKVVVSISPEFPGVSKRSAGAGYFLRHVEALVRAQWRVTVVSPGDSGAGRNAEVAESQVRSIRVVLPRSHRLYGRPLKLIDAFRGLSLGLDAEVCVKRDANVKAAVAQSDVVEFQWTHSANLWKWVRKQNRHARLVLVCHDVYEQLWQRNADASASILMRLYSNFRRGVAARAERRILPNMDQIITFSDKDAALLRRVAPAVPVVVISPPLAGTEQRPSTRLPREETVALFTGALGLEKNHHGVMWFLHNVWAEFANRSDYKFVVAGADPRPELIDEAARLGNVEVTGFVESLDPFYYEADLFVVPLFKGSGVKFKVISAMAAGLPVIATTVASEGIGRDEQYLGITDSPHQFATLIRSAHDSPGDLDALRFRAQEWARENYGQSEFEARLAGIYAQ